MLKYNSLWNFFFVILLLVSCGKEKVEKQIIRPVRYLQAFSTGGTRVRTFTGVAQAGLESRLSFRVPGTVQKVAVLIGDKIRRGQLIAQLDKNNFQLQVQQAEAALAQTNAQARNANANYERTRSLYENNNVSKSNLDGARAANESASAAVKASEKQLELTQLQLSYARLTAPVTGAIASINVEVNENIQAGQSVVVLTSGSQIEVRLAIPEILIAQVKEGSKVNVTFDALPEKQFSATVLEVGVSSTGMGTTFPVTVRLDKMNNEIRPGMAATVAFNLESKEKRERFIVPSHSVVEDRKGKFVYIVKPIEGEEGYGIIHRIAVTIGDLTADGIEIFEGLSDGDFVVTAGVRRISQGMKVKI